MRTKNTNGEMRDENLDENNSGLQGSPNERGSSAMTDYVHKSNAFGLKVLFWLVLMGVGSVLLVQAGFAGEVVGIILLGLSAAHGIELQHQALHFTGFPSKRLSKVAGFFLGLPLLISFTHYRDRHMHHHQNVGLPDDSEFFQYSKENNDRLLNFMGNMLMFPHWGRTLKLIVASYFGLDIGRVYNKNNEPAIRLEYRIFGAVVLVLLAAATFVPFLITVKFAIALGLASVLHTLLELPEHYKCERTANVFDNTRSIKSNLLLTWFTNGNNYHVEHHLFPALVPEQLASVHLQHRHKITHKCNGYMDFIRIIRNGS